MAKKNPFFAFRPETKTAKIKALDNAEIQYRELTLAENDAFNARMIKDFDPMDGNNPTIDLAEATAVKYEKVSKMLIDPPMTVDELKELGTGAGAAIDEILDLTNADESDLTDNEGN